MKSVAFIRNKNTLNQNSLFDGESSEKLLKPHASKAFMTLMSLSLILLAGCEANIEDAQKLGFESVEQMKLSQSQGFKNKDEWDNRYKKLGFDSMDQMNKLNNRNFKTYAEYLKAKEFSPLEFFKSCKEASLEIYDRRCKGKKIVWSGIPINKSDYGIRVVFFEGSEPLFAIDSKSMEKKIKDEDLGKEIDFEGYVGKQNTWHPDIDSVTYVDVNAATKLIPAAYFPQNWNWNIFEEYTVNQSINMPGMGYMKVPVQTNYYYVNESSPVKRINENMVELTYLESKEKGIISEFGYGNQNAPDIHTIKINCRAQTYKEIFKGSFRMKPKSENVVIDSKTGEKSVVVKPARTELFSFYGENKTSNWKESKEISNLVYKACLN